MISLYLHIPFCEKKCLYCSFVVAIAQGRRVDEYLQCLRQEAAVHQGRDVETIYVGGGTPTFMNREQLRTMMDVIRRTFRYSSDAEFTVEANPEGLDEDKIKLLLDLGVNRISLGVQTFHDRHLQYLGRCHDSRQAVDAFQRLRKAGCRNVNVDLMCSFPQQTMPELETDIRALLDLHSEHVSLYTLTVEPHSRFYVQKVQPLDNREQVQRYELTVGLLDRAGLRQYEVSNFAMTGKESRHNMNYWQGGNYFGLGVGAHSHLDGKRSWNVSRLNEYLGRLKNGASPQGGEETLSPEQRLLETLLLQLRTRQGADIPNLEKRFACPLPREKGEKILEFVRNRFLSIQDGRVTVTSQGRWILDELSTYLI